MSKTNMATDLEISKALALAIGWIENKCDEHGLLDPDIAVFGGKDALDEVKVWDGDYWRKFDYRDPSVIWPIAERYNLFPYAMHLNGKRSGKRTGKWNVWAWDSEHIYESAAKAVAMAVMGGAVR